MHFIGVGVVHNWFENEVFIKPKPANGWYAKVDLNTGEIEEKKYRLKDTNNKEFWDSILNSSKFKEAVYNRYAISSHSIITDETIENEFKQLEEEDENE